MKPLLLIDANSLSYAAFYANSLQSNDGDGSQVPFSVLNTLRLLVSHDFKGYKPIFLWDSRSDFRKQLYPEYKANRSDTYEKQKKREEFAKQRDSLKKMLSFINVSQVSVDGYEADDLAFRMTQKAGDLSVVLLTGDRDWLQMLSRPGVAWVTHRADERRSITQATFKDETGVESVEQFVEMKALVGDPSDNIPGVGGVGEKTALQWLREYGSVENMLIKPPEKPSTALKRFLDNNPFELRGKAYTAPQEAFKRNKTLVDLSACPEFDWNALKVVDRSFDRQAFVEAAQRLSLATILHDVGAWLAPFEQLGETHGIG